MIDPVRVLAAWLAAAALTLAAALTIPPAVHAQGGTPPDNAGHLYTLDGFGGMHPDGPAPTLSSSAYWANWDIARGLALFADGSGGYLLDGFGGLHPVGSAPALSSAYAYWPNWDIARGIALLPSSAPGNPAGYVLDGYGGVHPFGSAPAVSISGYWPGWDIARGIALLPDTTASAPGGYVLDGDGGLHPFGSAPAVIGAPSWKNWDIARGVTLLASATTSAPAGYVLDGYGGLHPFGTAPAAQGAPSWSGWDIARGVVAWTAAPAGTGAGWVIDGFGGVHAFGGAPTVAAGGYWPNWDIARGLGGPGGDSGTRSVFSGGIIQNLTYSGQQYPLSCEAASLEMALSHEGIAAAQGNTLNQMGVDGRSGYYDYSGALHWGDPYANFVGNPSGSEPNLTGYGTYYPRVVAAAQADGATVLAGGAGFAPANVYFEVQQGHPVIAWIAYDWSYHSTRYWQAFDGRRVPWAGPIEHTVVVLGVNGSSVYVYNPASGPQWVARSRFEAAYASFADMAVVIS